jgi:hypothetical protein
MKKNKELRIMLRSEPFWIFAKLYDVLWVKKTI